MFLQADVLLGPFDSFHFNLSLDTNPVPISRTSLRLAAGVYLELCTLNCEKGLGDFSVDFLHLLTVLYALATSFEVPYFDMLRNLA